MNKIHTISFIAVALVVVFIVGRNLSNTVTLGGVPNVPSYRTASSTTYTIGHQYSTKVLDQRGGRGYANFCNNTANRAYLVTTSTNVTSTSTAFALMDAGECYEITPDNLIVGEIHAIADTGTTTTKFIVAELIGQ